MTCIVGLALQGNVFLGGDRAAVDGATIFTAAEPKVFRRGPFIVGYTTSFRMGQLLEHQLTVPELVNTKDAGSYMRGTFVDALRKLFADAGWRSKRDEREIGGAFLVGFADRLWHVDEDFQVTRWDEPYAAVGSGAACALGALGGIYCLEAALFLTPHQVLLAALRAAALHTTTVRGPFDIIALHEQAPIPHPSPIGGMTAAASSAPAPPPPSADPTGAS